MQGLFVVVLEGFFVDLLPVSDDLLGVLVPEHRFLVEGLCCQLLLVVSHLQVFEDLVLLGLLLGSFRLKFDHGGPLVNISSDVLRVIPLHRGAILALAQYLLLLLMGHLHAESVGFQCIDLKFELVPLFSHLLVSP